AVSVGRGGAGAGGDDSGGAGGVGAEAPPVEDTAAMRLRPHPASPTGFSSVPQFPPRSSMQPLAAELGGVPAGALSIVGEEEQQPQKKVELQPQQERVEEEPQSQQQVQLQARQERVGEEIQPK
ncbi:unnamed protein product, partial [Closterium sp. NIES-54]